MSAVFDNLGKLPGGVMARGEGGRERTRAAKKPAKKSARVRKAPVHSNADVIAPTVPSSHIDQAYDAPLPRFIKQARTRERFEARFKSLRRWLAHLSILQAALIVSVSAHVVVLSVNFIAPHIDNLKSNDARLDVILVNARSETAPAKADALAQTNLDGGGDKDKGRATSPLARSPKVQDGDDVKSSQQRQKELEKQQQQLMTALVGKTSVAPEQAKIIPLDAKPQPDISGADLAASALAIARLEAEISKNIDDYNKIPKRRVLSPATREVAYAAYHNAFVGKVERIGQQSFPEDARNVGASSLVVSVVIKKDGRVSVIEIIRESEHSVFNRAARDIIKKAGGFAPFPPSMPWDEFEIITKWTFSKDGAFDSVQSVGSR